MLKRITYVLIMFIIFIPNIVSASIGSLVKVGNKYYDNLTDAILAAGPNDIITLISDVTLTKSISINKTVNINLNKNNIQASEKVFQVEGGVLNITGTGTIRETNPNYGAIFITGSKEETDKNHSIVNVGENVTLEGWAGIFINHKESKSYGVVVNLDGKINAINDINGDAGVGIYINGNIKNYVNHPVINISDTAEIGSTGAGLYIAGSSTFNIGPAYIKGEDAAIAIKAGNLNINGTAVIGAGPDKTPTEGYNNGIKPSGTAIQIESNNGYAGNIQINIKDGHFISKHSNVIYEYIGKGTNTQVKSISISGGTFESEANKNVFLLSNNFKATQPTFITGGTYTSSPDEFLEPGYKTVKDDNIYKVSKSTMQEVLGTNLLDNNKPFSIIIILLFIISLIIIYLNRTKIINLLKNKLISK